MVLFTWKFMPHFDKTPYYHFHQGWPNTKRQYNAHATDSWWDTFNAMSGPLLKMEKYIFVMPWNYTGCSAEIAHWNWNFRRHCILFSYLIFFNIQHKFLNKYKTVTLLMKLEGRNILANARIRMCLYTFCFLFWHPVLLYRVSRKYSSLRGNWKKLFYW